MTDRIQNQKYGTLTEAELLEILRLLGKGGYTTHKAKERENGKETGKYVHYVSFEGDRK